MHEESTCFLCISLFQYAARKGGKKKDTMEAKSQT